MRPSISIPRRAACIGELSVLRDDAFRVWEIHRTNSGYHYFVPRNALYRPAVSKQLHGAFCEPATHQSVRYLCTACQGSIVHCGAFFGDMLSSFSQVIQGRF